MPMSKKKTFQKPETKPADTPKPSAKPVAKPAPDPMEAAPRMYIFTKDASFDGVDYKKGQVYRLRMRVVRALDPSHCRKAV